MDDSAGTTPAGRLTRAQTAARLDISVAGVRRREGKLLHPQRGPKGEVLFEAAEVEAELRRIHGGACGQESSRDTADSLVKEEGPSECPPPHEAAEGRHSAATELQPVTPLPAGQGEDIALPAPLRVTPERAVDPVCVIFADLNGGKKLCDIVASRGLAPAVVLQAYEQWMRLTQIDTLKTPAGERRLRVLETSLDGQKDAINTVNDHVFSVQERIDALERTLGMGPEAAGPGS